MRRPERQVCFEKCPLLRHVGIPGAGLFCQRSHCSCAAEDALEKYQASTVQQVPEDCLFGHMSPASASFMIQAVLQSLLVATSTHVSLDVRVDLREPQLLHPTSAMLPPIGQVFVQQTTSLLPRSSHLSGRLNLHVPFSKLPRPPASAQSLPRANMRAKSRQATSSAFWRAFFVGSL